MGIHHTNYQTEASLKKLFIPGQGVFRSQTIFHLTNPVCACWSDDLLCPRLVTGPFPDSHAANEHDYDRRHFASPLLHGTLGETKCTILACCGVTIPLAPKEGCIKKKKKSPRLITHASLAVLLATRR
jgi:hypothetical protein